MNNLTEEQQEDKFKNRKKMAWISMFNITLFFYVSGFTTFFKDKSTGELDIMHACLYCFCSVILSYFGVTAYQYVKGK